MTHDDELVAGLTDDFRAVELTPTDRVMVDFVAKLTEQPQRMERRDVDALREHGFSDRAVHDIVVVTAYYAFVNRIADGLGVELEPAWGQDDP